MFSPNTANAMCCFGDPGRHLEVKVENRGGGEEVGHP